MNINQALLSPDYRALFDDIADEVYRHPEKIPDLLQCTPDEKLKFPRHLSHILAVVAERDFEKVKPYREDLIEYMFQHDKLEAVVRNILRIVKEKSVPDTYHGRMTDFSFRKLSPFPTPVAIKVYCMIILLRLCSNELELLRELKLIIEEYMPHGSAL